VDLSWGEQRGHCKAVGRPQSVRHSEDRPSCAVTLHCCPSKVLGYMWVPCPTHPAWDQPAPGAHRLCVGPSSPLGSHSQGTGCPPGPVTPHLLLQVPCCPPTILCPQPPPWVPWPLCFCRIPGTQRRLLIHPFFTVPKEVRSWKQEQVEAGWPRGSTGPCPSL
jgi:hypothetical protein